MAESSPRYTTKSWNKRKQYVCPCGYTTFDHVKIDAHCALPHAAEPEVAEPAAPQRSAASPAKPRVTHGSRAPAKVED